MSKIYVDPQVLPLCCQHSKDFPGDYFGPSVLLGREVGRDNLINLCPAFRKIAGELFLCLLLSCFHFKIFILSKWHILGRYVLVSYQVILYVNH